MPASACTRAARPTCNARLTNVDEVGVPETQFDAMEIHKTSTSLLLGSTGLAFPPHVATPCYESD